MSDDTPSYPSLDEAADAVAAKMEAAFEAADTVVVEPEVTPDEVPADPQAVEVEAAPQVAEETPTPEEPETPADTASEEAPGEVAEGEETPEVEDETPLDGVIAFRHNHEDKTQDVVALLKDPEGRQQLAEAFRKSTDYDRQRELADVARQEVQNLYAALEQRGVIRKGLQNQYEWAPPPQAPETSARQAQIDPREAEYKDLMGKFARTGEEGGGLSPVELDRMQTLKTEMLLDAREAKRQEAEAATAAEAAKAQLNTQATEEFQAAYTQAMGIVDTDLTNLRAYFTDPLTGQPDEGAIQIARQAASQAVVSQRTFAAGRKTLADQAKAYHARAKAILARIGDAKKATRAKAPPVAGGAPSPSANGSATKPSGERPKLDLDAMTLDQSGVPDRWKEWEERAHGVSAP